MEKTNIKVQVGKNFDLPGFKYDLEQIEILISYKLTLKERFELLFKPYLYTLSQTIDHKEAPLFLTIDKSEIKCKIISDNPKIDVEVLDF